MNQNQQHATIFINVYVLEALYVTEGITLAPQFGATTRILAYMLFGQGDKHYLHTVNIFPLLLVFSKRWLRHGQVPLATTCASKCITSHTTLHLAPHPPQPFS